MDSISFQVDLTKKEFVAFKMWAFFIRDYRRALIIVFGAAILLCDIILICAPNYFSQYNTVINLIIVLSNIIMVLLPIITVFNARRAYESKEFKKTVAYTITPESITINTTEVSKEKIYRIYNMQKYIYVAVSTLIFFILPKDRIPQDELPWVLSYINELSRGK